MNVRGHGFKSNGWKHRWTKAELEHIAHLETELVHELVDVIKNWCELKDVGHLTPPLTCGAALDLAATLTFNAHKHYGGPGLDIALEAIRRFWEAFEK